MIASAPTATNGRSLEATPFKSVPRRVTINGFFLIRGDAEQLNALQATEEWMGFLTRGGLHLEGAGAIRGVTGNMVMDWMSRFMQAIPS